MKPNERSFIQNLVEKMIFVIGTLLKLLKSTWKILDASKSITLLSKAITLLITSVESEEYQLKKLRRIWETEQILSLFKESTKFKYLIYK
jgi:ribosomal protein L7/L12